MCTADSCTTDLCRRLACRPCARSRTCGFLGACMQKGRIILGIYCTYIETTYSHCAAVHLPRAAWVSASPLWEELFGVDARTKGSISATIQHRQCPHFGLRQNDQKHHGLLVTAASAKLTVLTERLSSCLDEIFGCKPLKCESHRCQLHKSRYDRCKYSRGVSEAPCARSEEIEICFNCHHLHTGPV